MRGARSVTAGWFGGWTDRVVSRFAGAAIFVTVLAINFLGDGLRDAINPRAGRR